MKTCHIFCAAEFEGLLERPAPGDWILAADGGLRHLQALALEPTGILGDFDSLGYTPQGPQVDRFPVEKDDTDMLLAVREGFLRGFSHFYLFGGMGGRLDHTLANLQTLAFIAERGGIGYLIGKGFTAAAVRNGTLCFPAGMTGTISVFALGEPARGVYLTGLYYPLTDATLTPVWPLGVSNAFTGKAAAVAVRDGTLNVLWEGGALPSASAD